MGGGIFAVFIAAGLRMGGGPPAAAVGIDRPCITVTAYMPSATVAAYMPTATVTVIGCDE